MDDKLHSSFIASANTLSLLYRELKAAGDENFRAGRVEGLQEQIAWAEELEGQGLKYLPVADLIRMTNAYSDSIKIEEFPESRKRVNDDWQ